jgi:hypothetical protein
MSLEIENKLFNIFDKFLRDLSKTYPEIKNSIYRNYEFYLNDNEKKYDECDKLKKFLSLIQENEDYILDKNSEFFDLEIELLEEISFKRLWEKNITGKTRETIWKYLKTFQMININLNSNQELIETLNKLNSISEDNKDKDNEDSITINKQTAKDLKKLKQLSNDVKDNKSNDNDNTSFDSMFGGLLDSNIGSIAKEVAENMNIEEMFGNINENSDPSQIMGQMMNPENLGNIFSNINKIMEDKVKNGELDPNNLQNEASGMLDQMGNNNLFSDLMGQMNNEMNNNQDNQDNQELTREEKKAKLRQKINEKKNNR